MTLNLHDGLVVTLISSLTEKAVRARIAGLRELVRQYTGEIRKMILAASRQDRPQLRQWFRHAFRFYRSSLS